MIEIFPTQTYKICIVSSDFEMRERTLSHVTIER